MNAPFGYIKTGENKYWIDRDNEWQGEGDQVALNILRQRFPAPEEGWDPMNAPGLRMQKAADTFGLEAVGIVEPEFDRGTIY